MAITINGTGTITGISAGGLPDAIITQPELAAGVAGTGPAFNVSMSANQSVSAGVITKLQLDTEVFDTNNCFNTSTYRFTPTVAGYYQINGLLSSSSGTNYMSVWVYKNGSNVGVTFSNNEFGLCASTSVVVYLNGSTDYIELYGALSASGQIYGPDTRMSGSLVRAA